MHHVTRTRRVSGSRFLAASAALSLAVAAGLGCDKQEEVRAYDAPKATTADTTTRPAETVSASPAAPSYPKPAAAEGAPTWTLPSGWKEVPSTSSMRYASIQVTEKNPAIQLTVIALPPQGLVENINRWEGELGNAPSSAEKVQQLVTKHDFGGSEGYITDLSGPGKTPGGPKMRTLAAMVNRGRQVWFFKLMGPDDVVAEQKPSFDLFVKSVKFGGKPEGQGSLRSTTPLATLPLPTILAASTFAAVQYVSTEAGWSVPTLQADGGEKITKYVAPKGWEEDKTPRMMRVMTFFVKEGDKQAEVSVLKLGAGNIGPLLANVNRWRAQVGAPPVESINEKDIPKVTISGKDAYLFEFAGPNEKEPTKRMFITLGERGEDVYFFKIMGDAALVATQKEAFNQFLKSVEFGK